MCLRFLLIRAVNEAARNHVQCVGPACTSGKQRLALLIICNTWACQQFAEHVTKVLGWWLQALPFAALAYALAGIMATLLCALPPVRWMLLVITG
jgi:hypothetical protein